MNIIKKKVKKTGSNINLLFSLENIYKLSGMYTHDNQTTVSTQNIKSYTVAGVCDSRLSELKKYTASELLENKYIIYDGNNNGVILSKSNENEIYYIIDNIEFKDTENETTFILLTNKIDNIKEYVKFVDDKYFGYVDIKINTNVIVERQEIDIIPDHYRLNSFKILNDVEFYGSGYFNVYSN